MSAIVLSVWRIGSLLLLALAWLCLSPAAAAEQGKAPSAFEEANRFYEQRNYPEAIRRYENLLRQGISAEVLYNLGNARFRNGDIGLAIDHYLQARRLAPRDADVQANLRFARQTVPGTVSIQPGIFARMLNYFTLDEIAVVLALALWVWLGLLTLRQCVPRWQRTLRAPAMVAGLFFLATAAWLALAASAQSRPVAIVTVEQAGIRLGPVIESQTAFTASDGVELRVINARPGWIQVQDRSGRSGWVQESSVTLFP